MKSRIANNFNFRPSSTATGYCLGDYGSNMLFHFQRHRGKADRDSSRPLEVRILGDDINWENYWKIIEQNFSYVFRFVGTFLKPEAPDLFEQLVSFSDQFSLADSLDDDEVKVEKAKKWFEQNKDYLIIYECPLGLDFSKPPEYLPLPKSHNDYFLITTPRFSVADYNKLVFGQFKIFSQLALFRLILDEKSHFGESRSWESFFVERNILNLDTWVDGSWKWDAPEIKSLTSSIFGDAIGRLASKGKENEEVASFIRRSSFEITEWEDVVPSFLVALLSVEKLWEDLGFNETFYAVEKIRQEKKRIMSRDAWPYSESMGDFAEYLPEDSDYKEIIQNLDSYRKKYKKGYAEYNELEAKEQKILLAESTNDTDEATESDSFETSLHLHVVSSSEELLIYGVQYARDLTMVGHVHAKIDLTDLGNKSQLNQELQKVGKVLLLAKQLNIRDEHFQDLHELVKLLRHPLLFILQWKRSLSYVDYYDLNLKAEPHAVCDELFKNIQRSEESVDTGNGSNDYPSIREPSSRYSSIRKEIHYQSSLFHINNFLEIRDLRKSKSSNVVHIYDHPFPGDLDYTGYLESARHLVEKEVLRKLANYKKGEVICDPDAGRGNLLHWFVDHFDHRSDGQLPKYLHGEELFTFFPIAEFLLKGSLVDSSNSINSSLPFLFRDQSLLIISDCCKSFDGNDEHYKLEVCYNALGDNSRALLLVNNNFFQQIRELSKIRKEIMVDGSLKLVVKIGTDNYLLYLDRGNSSKLVNFLCLETEDQITKFFKDSNPLRFVHSVDNLDAGDEYQFWQAKSDDILQTKEIDLTPSRWKPQKAPEPIIGDDVGNYFYFQKNLQKEISKDQELMNQLSDWSPYNSNNRSWVKEKIDEVFDIFHSDFWFGKKRSLGAKGSVTRPVDEGMGLYGTGFERTMYTGTPKILEDDIWVEYNRSGLVLAICKRNPKEKGFFKSGGEEIEFSDRHYFLSSPTITVTQWSTDRSVLALLPKAEMSSVQLEFYQFWWDVVGRRFIFGLEADFEGLVPLVGAQKIPVLKDPADLKEFILTMRNLKTLYDRRAKISANRYRDHAKSLFDALGAV